MIKLKNILLEKKELDSKFIYTISKLTDANNHTRARIELSKMLKNKKLMLVYQKFQLI